jgi:hypothetical protein
MLQFVAQQPIRRDAELIFSASPIPGGTVIRIAATSTERMSTWLRDRLGFVEDSVGQNPWARVR